MKNKYYDMYIKYIQVSLHRRDIHSLYIHNMHRHEHETPSLCAGYAR